MDLRLAGQTAFITGGSKGIGRECAYQLAQEGCSVAITARDAANLEKAAKAIANETGRRILPLPVT
jgi:3-oxoacyl-[acyl-carrier protein] reductase